MMKNLQNAFLLIVPDSPQAGIFGYYSPVEKFVLTYLVLS